MSSRVRAVAARPLKEIIEPGWADALEPVAERIAAMGDFLRAEIAADARTCPPGLMYCGRSSSRSRR